jgi:regulator of RNase E activity RraB
MSTDWNEDWDSYLSALEDHTPISYTLDLGIASVAPLASHPLRLLARVALQKPDSSGLLVPDEMRAFHQFQEAFFRSARDIGGIAAGRCVERGHAILAVYLPEKSTINTNLLSQELANTTAYTPKISLKKESDWTFYLDFLYPDEYMLQSIRNRRVLDLLEDRGDLPDENRQIVHWASFPTREKLEAAAEKLRKCGYSFELPNIENDPIEDWMFAFSKIQSLDQEVIDTACWEILDVVTPLDGQYDGWETEFITRSYIPHN